MKGLMRALYAVPARRLARGASKGPGTPKIWAKALRVGAREAGKCTNMIILVCSTVASQQRRRQGKLQHPHSCNIHVARAVTAAGPDAGGDPVTPRLCRAWHPSVLRGGEGQQVC
jgi:hypothetical protein